MVSCASTHSHSFVHSFIHSFIMFGFALTHVRFGDFFAGTLLTSSHCQLVHHMALFVSCPASLRAKAHSPLAHGRTEFFVSFDSQTGSPIGAYRRPNGMFSGWEVDAWHFVDTCDVQGMSFGYFIFTFNCGLVHWWVDARSFSPKRTTISQLQLMDNDPFGNFVIIDDDVLVDVDFDEAHVASHFLFIGSS